MMRRMGRRMGRRLSEDGEEEQNKYNTRRKQRGSRSRRMKIRS